MASPSLSLKSKASPPPEFSLRVKLLNTLVYYFPRRFVPKRLVKSSAKFTSHALVLGKSIERNIENYLPPAFEFTIATPSDIELIARHKEGLEFNVYQKRSHQNDFCCILKLNGSIVSYNWLSYKRMGIFLGFDKEIIIDTLSPHQAFTYDFYTYKKNREKGYGTLLKQCIIKYLSENSINHVLSCVQADSNASLTVHLKNDYYLKQIVFNARIMDWTISFVSTAKEQERFLIWFRQYQHALVKAQHE